MNFVQDSEGWVFIAPLSLTTPLIPALGDNELSIVPQLPLDELFIIVPFPLDRDVLGLY